MTEPSSSSVSNVKSKKGQKAEDDSEDSDVDDLDDEEVSLGSMDEEDFGEELDEEGGMFMDPDGHEEDEDDEGTRIRFCAGFLQQLKTTVFSLFQFQSWRMRMRMRMRRLHFLVSSHQASSSQETLCQSRAHTHRTDADVKCLF